MKVISIILLVMGIFLFLFGFLFKIMHWPAATMGMLIGGTLTTTGLALFIVSQSKKRNNKM